MNTLARRPKTQLLVDGGDPEETLRVKRLIGYVDGQTTNPTLVAKNPEVRTPGFIRPKVQFPRGAG